MVAQPRTDTPALLLSSTRRCLQRLGYRRTTARAISASSGANLRSIGYHYGSVRALVLLALSRNFRDWLAPLFAPAAPERAAATLVEGLKDFTASYPSNAGIVSAWLQAVGDARDDPELRRALAENQRGFRDAFAANLAAAGVPEPTLGADALITICDGLMIRHLLHDEIPALEDVARTAAATFALLAS
jgi:AcrR family transcriptional regulator